MIIKLLVLFSLLGTLAPSQGGVLGDGRLKVKPLGTSLLTDVSVQSHAAAGIIVRDAWIQEGPPSQKITAAFMVIENHSSIEISLLSADMKVARAVEIHKTETEDGMMRMRKVNQISISAGESIELKPGGYHLMVIDLNRELNEGDEVELALHFSNEIRKMVMVPVKKRSSKTEKAGTK